jgi:hypothetical protein
VQRRTARRAIERTAQRIAVNRQHPRAFRAQIDVENATRKNCVMLKLAI